MNAKNKIKAFTLSEMIVVVILTSVVVGMAFSILKLVQKHMHQIQYNFNKNTDINKLEQSLWIDFNRYQNITYQVSYDKLVFSTEIDSTTYLFTDNHIIKDKDTFNVEWHQRTCFFNGTIVRKGYIDALKLELSERFQNQILFVFKQNDATIHMNIHRENKEVIRLQDIFEKK